MKHFFTLLLFLSYITAYGQAFCYPFGRQKMSPFNINNGNCYDFNKRNPSGSGSLNIGIGTAPLSYKDNDGLFITTAMLEMDYVTWGGGIQADIRSGNHYIINRITNEVPIVSIDTRFYGYKAIRQSNFKAGGFIQINSTGMWADGFATGPILRYTLDYKRFGVGTQVQIPIYNIQRTAINSFNDVDNTYWFGFPERKDIPSNRPTEYRAIVFVYLRLVHDYYSIKRNFR